MTFFKYFGIITSVILLLSCGGGGAGPTTTPTVKVTCADGSVVDGQTANDLSNCKLSTFALTASTPLSSSKDESLVTDLTLTFNEQLTFKDSLLAEATCELISDTVSIGTCALVGVSPDKKSVAVVNQIPMYFSTPIDYALTENIPYLLENSRSYQLKYTVKSWTSGAVLSGTMNFTTVAYKATGCPSPSRANYLNDCVYPIYGNRLVDDSVAKTGIGQNIWNPVMKAWVAKQGVHVEPAVDLPLECEAYGDTCWKVNVANQKIKLIDTGMQAPKYDMYRLVDSTVQPTIFSYYKTASFKLGASVTDTGDRLRALYADQVAVPVKHSRDGISSGYVLNKSVIYVTGNSHGADVLAQDGCHNLMWSIGIEDVGMQGPTDSASCN